MSLVTSLFNSPLSSAASPATAKTAKADSSSSSTTTSSTSSVDNIGSTFLSLLVQELQNQDPTAPMDSTAMVGQMISLNQLNQLTNINQVLSNAYGSTSAGSSSGTPAATGHVRSATQSALQLLNANAATSRPAVAASVTLPAF